MVMPRKPTSFEDKPVDIDADPPACPPAGFP
jgi:hypothetical protein